MGARCIFGFLVLLACAVSSSKDGQATADSFRASARAAHRGKGAHGAVKGHHGVQPYGGYRQACQWMVSGPAEGAVGALPTVSGARGSTKAVGSGLPILAAAHGTSEQHKKTEAIRLDAVVALDGSGNYTTIAAAIEYAQRTKGPARLGTWFVVYIKQGTYYEHVVVRKHNRYVTLIGDGIGKTIITGHLSMKTSHSMPETATLTAHGLGFMARDITIENTAGGMEDEQAVAFRSTANRSVLYGCELKGFQDTLYAERGLQFYRNCTISGTVDFVFGDATALFQDCLILVRRPANIQQHNVITAEGRNAPENHTGFSFQNCTITTRENITGLQTYLGRPWKKYSLVVFMMCSIDDIVHESGWVAWHKGNNKDSSTVVYREYKNYRLGSNTSRRSIIDLEGVQVIPSDEDAAQYTVKHFIFGDNWLPETGAEFDLGLYH